MKRQEKSGAGFSRFASFWPLRGPVAAWNALMLIFLSDQQRKRLELSRGRQGRPGRDPFTPPMKRPRRWPLVWSSSRNTPCALIQRGRAFPASITLSDVCIKNMQDSAVWIDGKGSLTIEGCNFTDNSAVSGAHIWIGLEVVAEITDTSFIGGDGRTGSGGAIRSSSELYIFNCVFDGNNAKSGGAIYIGRGRCEMETARSQATAPHGETTAASKANDSTGTEDSTPRGNYSGYTSPVTIRRAPEPADNPEPVATVEPEPPALICGGAVLDPSNRAYLNGYGDGVIGEDDPITRAQIAQLFYRLLTEESRAALSGAESKFDDAPASAWYHPAVSAIASAGVVIGCGDGFHPNEYLTRAQLITIMARFIEPMEHESGFADISGHWAENYIKTAEAAGWITADGDLRPDEYVTRGETVTFINTVLDAQTRGTPPALPND